MFGTIMTYKSYNLLLIHTKWQILLTIIINNGHLSNTCAGPSRSPYEVPFEVPCTSGGLDENGLIVLYNSVIDNWHRYTLSGTRTRTSSKYQYG